MVESLTETLGSIPEFDAHSFLLNFASGKENEAWLLRFKYSDGKRNKKSFVAATYCPLCGEKMKKETVD
jgi:hypothetical protein